jgi:VanZ family protein
LRLAILWGPVVAIMVLIYSASSMSDPGTPPGGISDKAAHFLAYAGLGAALLRALAGGRSAAMTPRRIWLATILAVLYGVSDEFHQTLVPGRSPEMLDVVADACGGLAGAAFLAAAARVLNRLKALRASS